MRYLIVIICLCIAWSLTGQNFETYYKAAVNNNPQLKATFNQYYSTKERSTQVKLPPPSVALGVFVLPVETRLGAQRFRLGATQMFPAFGALKAKKSLIHEQGVLKLQEAQVIRNQLYFNLRDIWYQASEIKALTNVEWRNLELLKTLEKLALQKVENGQGSLADVYQIKMEQNNRVAKIELLENKLPVLELAFAQLVKEDSLPFPATMDTITLRQLTYPKDSLMVWMRHQNPQMGLLEAQRRVANQKMMVQKTKNRPTYGVGLNYTFLTKRTDANPSQNGQGILMPTFSIQVPIYKDQNQARVKEVVFELKALDYQEEHLMDNLEVQLENMLTSYRAAQINLKHYRAQIAFTQKTLDLLLAEYSVDNKSIDEILQLERSLLNYQQKLIEYSIVQNRALIGLEQLFAQPLFN
ncbi:TolC family protein [Aureispira sp. CCB-QB1]|uniref:TolC family protein n=1 Tax=Aureispira sp. CCB-QB1 TaxID=1313421 RepID=UPI000695B47C|nr:TolC family protein [Aureispira sp. CCB-QB1]